MFTWIHHWQYRPKCHLLLVEGFLNEAIETITDLNIKILISKMFLEKINKTNFKTDEY